MIMQPEILPQRGRGTTKWWKGASEKARGSAQRRSRRPLPSALRTATSPVGGVSGAQHTTPVTLNLFQGPFLVLRRSAVTGANRAVAGSRRGLGSAARWMLKQVQHDGIVREAAE